MKTQFVRLLDIFVFVPSLLNLAGHLTGKAKRTAEIMAVSTLIYNARNYMIEEAKIGGQNGKAPF